MFKRSFASRDRAGKATKPVKKSFGSFAKQSILEQLDSPTVGKSIPHLTSAVITIVVGADQRLFAAHEEVLCRSPFFKKVCDELFFSAESAKRIDLVDEDPETFSCILEYLYKTDYSPRLLSDKTRSAWYLEDPQDPLAHKTSGSRGQNVRATLYHSCLGDVILRDTAVYCAADRYGLGELKRLALRKQGLQSGIEVATILRSARYAYENTPDDDSRIRAHYLALIIRSRKIFKRSGTMQKETEMGGRMFFDLFVAMCNHMDDLAGASCSPKTI